MSNIEEKNEIIPFENLETTARDLSKNFLIFTRKNLNEGWERDKFRISSVLPPIDWGAHNRSFSYHLHAWDAIADLLMAYDRLGDEDFFDASLAHARSWVEEFQIPLLGRDSPEQLDSLVLPTMPVEWYDMAVGLRAYRIAYILDILIKRKREHTRDIDLFQKALLFHLKLLRREHFFREHSNHGLYQALGHLAAARRFYSFSDCSEDYAIATERLLRILNFHFADDGPHKEHSPGYHFMILGTMINARRSNLLEGDQANEALRSIENAFTWMVKPNWQIATFGDTDPRGMVRQTNIAELFVDPSAQYIISGKALGTTPDFGVKPYYDAGYAFARLHATKDGRTFENASYLAQIAAFHSRVHKHADHLGFLWYDRGRDILIDPGRYAYAGRTETGSDLFNQGFWYSDPKRIYIESTRAHNCVEIDDRSYPRRSVKPFGSALRYAGEQNGLAVTDCEVTHFRTVRHRRVLVMAPAQFLLVLDWLNDRTTEHDYRQWFQFAPEWQVETSADGLFAQHPSAPAMESGDVIEPSTGILVYRPNHQARATETLSIFNLIDENTISAPVRGQAEPRLQGWISDAAYSLISCTSLAIESLARPMARFATLFAFGESIRINQTATRFNTSMRNGSVAWSDNCADYRLEITLGEPGAVSTDLQSRPR